MEKKCIHDGHRKRLIDTVFNGGLDNLSEIQVAEFLLFYVFPRGDVNPLAHKLIDRFGNIANIIDADINELKSIAGIGDVAAKKIIGIGELFNKVNDYRAKRYDVISSTEDLCDYFEEMLRFLTTENFYIVGFDHKFRIVGKKKLTSSSSGNVGVTPIMVANFISSTKPAGIVIAHNHPNGFCTPSKQDEESTMKLKNLVESLGVKFVEHIIVGNDGIYGVERGSVLRVFID